MATVFMGLLDGKCHIIIIHLEYKAKIEGASIDAFQEMPEATKSGCTVSMALSNVPMTLSAKLV